MELFCSIIFGVAMFCAGYLFGNREVMRNEEIRKADMRMAQRLIDEQYKKGYDDGVRKTVNKLYDTYKRNWCEARGYILENIDEGTGVNGECYACFDEWYQNEYLEGY